MSILSVEWYKDIEENAFEMVMRWEKDDWCGIFIIWQTRFWAIKPGMNIAKDFWTGYVVVILQVGPNKLEEASKSDR